MSSKTKTATPASSSAHIKSIAITAICLVLAFPLGFLMSRMCWCSYSPPW